MSESLTSLSVNKAINLKLLSAIMFLPLVGSVAPNSDPLVFNHGTSIVVRKTATELVVGADSLSTVSTTGVKLSHCKIKAVANVFFTMAGEIREKVTNFNSEEIVTEALKRKTTVVERVKAFETNVLPPLTDVVKRTRKSANTYFERRQRDKFVLQVAFFGLDDQRSIYLYVRSYKARVSDANDTIVEPQRPINCLGPCVVFDTLGNNNAIRDYLSKNPHVVGYLKNPQLSPVSSVDLVRGFVQLEIDRNPVSAGPPVDILRVDGNGAKWIQRKSECEK